MPSKKINWCLVGLIILSALTHFIFLSYPSEVVFDEFYFGKFASDYLTKTPYFDIHPPLGKMMLASAGSIFNIETNCTFEEIGHPCSPNIFFALRFLPALFGTLSVILFYAFIKLLTNSKKIALIGGFLFIFENALLVQSRHIFLDIFLLFFGLLSLYFFIKATKKNYLIPSADNKYQKKQWLFLTLSGLSLGACMSIKWTGIGFGGLLFFLMLIPLAEKKINFKKFVNMGVILASCVILVYSLQFLVHFYLLPNQGGPDSFLGQDFDDLSLSQKLITINGKMFYANQIIGSSHPATSRFYQWPLMKKPIGLWDRTKNNTLIQIQLFGNPVIWGLSSFGMLILLISLFFKRLRREIYLSAFFPFFLLVGFLINLLPFTIVGRSTYLYHYFPAYTFAIFNLAIILNWVNKYNKKIFWILIFLIVVGFAVAAPATYGFPPILPLEKMTN